MLRDGCRCKARRIYRLFVINITFKGRFGRSCKKYLATLVRHQEDEAKGTVVKWDVLEWGGHWKVRLFGTFWGEQTATSCTGVRYSDTRVALLKSSVVLQGSAHSKCCV